MYRKLKNILGASLMILAVVIAQIPMPSAQAEKANEDTMAKESVHTVTFSMNGGNFSGKYNTFDYTNNTPVLVVDNGKTINIFPDDKQAVYSGYKTDKDIWYTDRQCLTQFDTNSPITDDITLYKKWYNITLDGTELSDKGFYISADKKVLYRYDGNETLVQIPETVTTIASNAFNDLEEVRGIVLPKNIEQVEENAFSGIENLNTIIYIDSSETGTSKEWCEKLSEKYENLAYSKWYGLKSIGELVDLDFSDAIAAHSQEEETEAANIQASQLSVTSATLRTAEVTLKTLETLETESEKTQEPETTATEPDSAESTATESTQTRESEPAEPAATEPTQTREPEPAAQQPAVAEPTQTPESEPAESAAATEPTKASESESTKPAEPATTEPTKTRESEPTAAQQPTATEPTQAPQPEEKTNTVTFNINGGQFTGNYKGTAYENSGSITFKIAEGKNIADSDYPESDTQANFKYSNYTTDSNWYTDKECLNVYTKKADGIKTDITLYKKWYHTASGFTMNASDNVLYKYNGGVEDVVIPNSVTIIGTDAFSSVGGISSITLPDNISDIRENAFSGLKNVSKNITITGKTENARNKAKTIANQYTNLEYKETVSTTDNNSSVVTMAESGSIRLGASISGSAGTTSTTTKTTQNAAAPNNTTASTGSITLGAGSISEVATASKSTTPAADNTTVTVVPGKQDTTTASVTQNSQGSSTQDVRETKTTTKTNLADASAPRSTQHIKDSTPKTGDTMQYRMLIACIIFSIGVLLILSGNGKRKKVSAF